MKQVNLQDVGLTDRYNRNRAQSNFKAIEAAFNGNAITAEEMYAELNGKLAAEANVRKAGDDSEARDRRAADATEAQTRAEADKELDGKITTEAQTRAEADKGLEQRIARLERYIFDGQPAFVDNLFPPQPSNGSIEVADNGELPPDLDGVVDGEVRDTPTNIFV